MQIVVYTNKCTLCRQKIAAPTESECREKLVRHIDSECKVAATMRDWEAKGIYKEMMGFLRSEGLRDDLQKLVKKYSLDAVRSALEQLEDERDGAASQMPKV